MIRLRSLSFDGFIMHLHDEEDEGEEGELPLSYTTAADRTLPRIIVDDVDPEDDIRLAFFSFSSLSSINENLLWGSSYYILRPARARTKSGRKNPPRCRLAL